MGSSASVGSSPSVPPTKDEKPFPKKEGETPLIKKASSRRHTSIATELSVSRRRKKSVDSQDPSTPNGSTYSSIVGELTKGKSRNGSESNLSQGKGTEAPSRPTDAPPGKYVPVTQSWEGPAPPPSFPLKEVQRRPSLSPAGPPPPGYYLPSNGPPTRTPSNAFTPSWVDRQRSYSTTRIPVESTVGSGGGKTYVPLTSTAERHHSAPTPSPDGRQLVRLDPSLPPVRIGSSLYYTHPSEQTYPPPRANSVSPAGNTSITSWSRPAAASSITSPPSGDLAAGEAPSPERGKLPPSRSNILKTNASPGSSGSQNLTPMNSNNSRTSAKMNTPLPLDDGPLNGNPSPSLLVNGPHSRRPTTKDPNTTPNTSNHNTPPTSFGVSPRRQALKELKQLTSASEDMIDVMEETSQNSEDVGLQRRRTVRFLD